MFGIVYDTEYEGRIIFGQYLNEVDKNYNAEEMVQTPNMDHSDTGNDNFEKWLMKFDLKCLSGIEKRRKHKRQRNKKFRGKCKKKTKKNKNFRRRKQKTPPCKR